MSKEIVHTSQYGDIKIPEMSFTEYIFSRAVKFGDKTAIMDGPTGVSLTFSELWTKIQGTAAGFQKRGITKGKNVGIWAPNCIEWCVAFYSVSLAGGIVVPVNPSYPSAEAGPLLAGADVDFLFVAPGFCSRLSELREYCKAVQEYIVLGEIPEGVEGVTALKDVEIQGAKPAAVEVDLVKDHILLPFSSGTTGLPKGVMLTHRNLVANIVQFDHPGVCNDYGALSDKDVVVALLPFFHAYGLLVIMSSAFVSGAKMITMPQFDPALYLKLLKAEGVTVAHVAPPLVQFLAKHPVVEKALPFSNLKEILCGAAPLGGELTTAAEERLEVKIRQGYGMTELSPVSHIDRIPGTPASIGYLLPSMKARIVDPETGVDQPAGTEKERGELWLTGPNVMKGYYKNEEATKGTIDSEGWLHTGDIAYVDKDGKYYIVDRLKELIKVKGFQVAPAELEAVLTSNEKVADAAVIGVPAEKYGGREGDGEYAKAFVILQKGVELSAEDLAEWLKDKVTSYKQLKPQCIEFVDTIPKSASGKILRKDLRASEAKKPGMAK